MKFKRYSTAEDTYTTLPATFQTSGADAENYQVYGKTVENLADAIIEHANITSDGRIFNPGAIDPAGDTFVLYIAPVVSGKAYTIATSTYDSAVVYAFYSTQPAYDVVSYNNARTVLEGTHQATITAPITGWIAFRDYVTAPAGMIVEGSTPAPIYVPPGASGGVGEQTENLFDSTKRQSNEGFWNNTGGYVNSSGWYGTLLIDAEPSTEYSFDPHSTAGSSAKHLFYNDNAELIGYISSGRQTFTTPDNCVKMRFSYRTSSSNIMLVKGSTAPTTYIPFGYKIPISLQSGVTENLWDGKFPSEPSSTNQYIPIYVGDGTFTLSTNAPRHLNQFCAYMFLAGNVETGGTSANNGVYAENPRTVQSVNGYVTIVYHYYSTADPRNYWGMLNKGTTPLPYEPHRYESNYDLFLGSTKLYEDEYVDFVEQKVYKRTENLWDGTYSAVGIFKANGDIGTNADYRVSDYIEIEGAITYSLTSDIARPTRTMYPVVWYNENKSILRTASVESIPGNEKYDFSYAAVPNAKYVRFNYRVTDTGIMLVHGSTPPETYIPYLQPTDPPVPFPAISTYIGENNLSVDTTVQPEKAVLEYAGWREIDAKKYVNGEWVTITPKQYTGGSWS